MKKSQRSKLLVTPSLQLALIVQSLFIALLTAASVHLSYFQLSFSEVNFFGVCTVSTEYLKFIPLAIALACVCWSFYFSNRIVGPIYAIQRQLEANLKNKTSAKIVVRKNDYFTKLVDVLNQTLESKNQRDRSDEPKA